MLTKKRFNKFRKAMNVSHIMFLMVMFSLSMPIFYLTYATREALNTKKVLQEAAYTGALAGTYAIDVSEFNNRSKSQKSSNLDKETGLPVAYMKQSTQEIRAGNKSVTNDNDCLNGSSPNNSSIGGGDYAAKEVVKAVETYLDKNLFYQDSRYKKETNPYSIAMVFEHNDVTGGSLDRYNKVTVSVCLKYKPLNKVFEWISKDNTTKNVETAVMYGTSSAKTRTMT